MTLQEIVTDQSFAGLHWSIRRDTPLEDREAAHVSAALYARRKRDEALKRKHVGPYDALNRVWLCCTVSAIEVASYRPWEQPYCKLRLLKEGQP